MILYRYLPNGLLKRRGEKGVKGACFGTYKILKLHFVKHNYDMEKSISHIDQIYHHTV